MAMDRPESESGTSELGAAEAFGSRPSEEPKDVVICPYCDRPVEAGFKFCDWCGKPLTKPAEDEPAVPSAAVEKPTQPEPAPERNKRFSLRRRRSESLAAQSEEILERQAKETAPAPPPRRAEPPATTRPIPGPITAPLPPRPPEVTAPAPSAAWEKKKRGVSAGGVLLYLVHLIVSFAAGALVLAAIAIIVALTSGGERTFLEMRGLPVFTGVSVSVAVFAVFRGTAPGAGWGRGARAAAIIGMLILVGAGAYLYRPVLLVEAQQPLERLAGVWTEADEEAVKSFQGELLTWNSRVDEYQRVVAAIIRQEITIEEFRGVTRTTEAALEDVLDGLEGSSSSTSNEKLRDALSSLVDAYEAQLAALRAVSRGILQGDFQSLQGGDAAFKEAQSAARERFEDQVRPLLERAGFDDDAFARAVEAE